MSGNELTTLAHNRLERVTPQDLQSEAIAIREIQKSVLVVDVDYGVIPGTKKPSLYKAGAEVLLKWAGLGYRVSMVDIDRDEDGKKYGVTYRASVYRLDNPEVPLAEADGYCGYDEAGRDAHVNDWGKAIPREPWNTIVAMASKRAVVSATRAATGTSGLFTQDAEDPAYRKRAEIVSQSDASAGPPVITAKFDSKCVVCGKAITKGEKVVYEKGKGAWHPGCDPRSGDGVDARPDTAGDTPREEGRTQESRGPVGEPVQEPEAVGDDGDWRPDPDRKASAAGGLGEVPPAAQAHHQDDPEELRQMRGQALEVLRGLWSKDARRWRPWSRVAINAIRADSFETFPAGWSVAELQMFLERCEREESLSS